MTKTSAFGFLPENDGKTNAAALQQALNARGDVYVDLPGVYALSDTVYIGDDTSLIFCSGAYVKREKNEEETGCVIINEGAFRREYNHNIKLIGMRLICNGVQSDAYRVGCKKGILGISAHAAFHYVKNLEIRGFEVHDLPEKDFGIQVCTFENILIENGVIEGLKDGVHLGTGRGFTIRHMKFRTFDDPIALNAHDYAVSNPEMGWIEDGIIEDCYDLDDDSTTGFFCRILAGSWGEWKKGMTVQNSDSVVYGGKIYRAFMPADGKHYIANAAPDENVGKANSDGIVWCITQENTVTNCGCRNIVFRDIFLKKHRPTAFSFHFDRDAYSRSYYPNTEAPVQENISFEHIYCQNEIPVLLVSRTPVRHIRFTDCVLNGNRVVLENLKTPGIAYPVADIGFDRTTFYGKSQRLADADKGIKMCLSVDNSFADDDFKAEIGGNIEVKKCDISLEKTEYKTVKDSFTGDIAD